jgi:hypothetical protein
MGAPATGGQTLGASAGARSIAPIGTVAPNDSGVEPFISAQTQMSEPWTGRHSP